MCFVRNWWSIVSAFFLFSIFTTVSARYVEGHIKTLDDWVFLARFCFLSGRGRYEYHIEFERRYGDPQLLLYYDDETQWPAIYKTGKTCAQKLSVLHPQDNQIMTLSAKSPHNIISGCALRTSTADKDTTLKPNIESPIDKPFSGEINASYFDQFLETSTESYGSGDFELFNASLSNFSDTEVFNQSQSVNYIPFGSDLNGFRNNLENDTISNLEDVEELFAKDFEGNGTNIRIKRGFGSAGTSFIVTCHSSGGFLTSRERWWYIAISNCGSKNGIDVKYKFRMTNGPPGDFWHEHFSADEMYIPPILLAEALVYVFLLLAIAICAIELKNRHLFHCTYRLFAMSASFQFFGVLFLGVSWSRYAVYGVGPYTGLGTVLLAAAEIVFLVLLLLMAKGYTITRARISTCSTIKMTLFINLYIVFYMSLFIYREEVFDPGEVLNLYESPGGLGIALLRCGSWGAFLVSIINTTRKFPEKSVFYYPFAVLGSMWILGGPILTFIGIVFFDPWVRESVMCAVFTILSISGHASFLWLTWPSRANISFPYHVRTNHVGVMAASDDGADYPRHVYEPSQDTNAQSIIIPLSRRTEELLNGVYSQYLCERQCYNSASTPLSHISFPNGQNLNQTFVQNNHNIQQVTGRKSPEEQHDSGHPSLEDIPSSSSSGKSNDDRNKLPEPSAPPVSDNSKTSSANSSASKRNPFVINSAAATKPNKIILDPINPPVQTNRLSDVPAHLFAARKN
ncbi:transmembrane protein 145-like [Episyrphus balteatus]|uniref:transmembrane protein 145-like n=1 Tax=Episyrphus balteatus TaxID=286459 RepID=UPI0024868813|nr:transmembrane protein 145-like [Episyrphus balteatus]